jgi:hypothetical protein
VTIRGTQILCDSYGCLEVAIAGQDEMLDRRQMRLPFAILGWQTGGRHEEFDFCSNHSPQGR